jgi:hypothetical protein
VQLLLLTNISSKLLAHLHLCEPTDCPILQQPEKSRVTCSGSHTAALANCMVCAAASPPGNWQELVQQVMRTL